VRLHSAIERSMPPLDPGGRTPQVAGRSAQAAASAVLDRCYAGAQLNRKDLPAMVRAACAGDEQNLDKYRLRAGLEAAGILADALLAAVSIR
jgi:hypothetical protein